MGNGGTGQCPAVVGVVDALVRLRGWQLLAKNLGQTRRECLVKDLGAMRLEADADRDEHELPGGRRISSHAALLLQVLEPAHEQRAFAPAAGAVSR